MNERNIKEEYEKVFGRITHENLFALDDVEYINLRQEILGSQIEFCNPFSRLPFDDDISYYYDNNKETQPIINGTQSNQEENLKCLENSHNILLLYKTIESLISHCNSLLGNTISALACYLLKKENVVFYYIQESGLCSAKGYFDNKARGFYVCKASKISMSQALRFNSTSTNVVRSNFIKNHCKPIKGYYQVLEDTLFVSANVAACVVLGKISASNRWKDQYGNAFFVK